MFDWFFHVFGLKSPREMDELHAQFQREIRQMNIDLARAMVEESGLTGEGRAQLLAKIEAAEKREE